MYGLWFKIVSYYVFIMLIYLNSFGVITPFIIESRFIFVAININKQFPDFTKFNEYFLKESKLFPGICLWPQILCLVRTNKMRQSYVIILSGVYVLHGDSAISFRSI